MSYNTVYHLTWFGGSPRRNCDHPIAAEAKFCSECGAAALSGVDAEVRRSLRIRSLPEPGHLGYLGELTWYGHQADLAAVSAENPGVLLHLRGRGESEGDLWDLFALDGRVQHHPAEIRRSETPDPAAWTTPEREGR
jgi:hypothetical protein